MCPQENEITMKDSMNVFSDYMKNLTPHRNNECQMGLMFNNQIFKDVILFYEPECAKDNNGILFVKAYEKNKDFLLQSLGVVIQHMSEFTFDLNRFASEMFVSKSTLHRAMHSLMGVSPCDFMLFIRMRYAQLLLTETSFQIAEVAAKVGFKSPKHFTFCFRKRFGHSPKVFREKQSHLQEHKIIYFNEVLFIQRLTHLIKDNISNPNYGLNNLICELGVSKSTLYRRIKASTRLSPELFIRSVKLNYARYLLKINGDVLDTVYASGFSDPKYFRRCFRKEFGELPKEVVNF